LAAVVVSVCAASSARAAVIMLDVDTTNAGTAINTQPGFTSYDASQAANGEGSIVVDGVTLTLFGGLGGSRQRANGGGGEFDALLRDFVFKDGNGSAVGLRLEGLPLGTYDVQSWHYDASFPGTIQVEVRNPGGTSTILADAIPFSTEPIRYQITVDDPGEVIELVFREDDALNRSRLNGIIIQPVPEPAGVLGLGLLALGLRRRGQAWRGSQNRQGRVPVHSPLVRTPYRVCQAPL
jgi:hypothetical protein